MRKAWCVARKKAKSFAPRFQPRLVAAKHSEDGRGGRRINRREHKERKRSGGSQSRVANAFGS